MGACCVQIFVPVGSSFGPELFDMEELHGGSAWGAGTFAGATGARQPTDLELRIAEHQVCSPFSLSTSSSLTAPEAQWVVSMFDSPLLLQPCMMHHHQGACCPLVIVDDTHLGFCLPEWPLTLHGRSRQSVGPSLPAGCCQSVQAASLQR